ncbi:MAG: NAD(P)H-binding protein, partial [Pseudomonadota bacterium]
MTHARIIVTGATGTIGRAVVAECVARGWGVVAFARAPVTLKGAEVRIGDPCDPESIARDGLCGERFDALVSCVASRTGVTKDAWRVDYGANVAAIAAARAGGVPHMVLLSAICVQKPQLAFQFAKLAAERALIGSGLDWTIVRPTAFFKSLSGQIGRVQRGKPFLLFGDGEATACKPISDADLAAFIAECVERPERRGRILPIGGPGPAITPRQQGEALFALTGREPKFRRVPVGLLSAIARGLSVIPGLAAKAELARIGHYYATESMLVWDAAARRYDADATPATGSDTLIDH